MWRNSDFPTTPGAWSSSISINCNLGVFKFELGLIYPDIDLVAPEIICPEDPIQFVNNFKEEVFLEFGDGNTTMSLSPCTFMRPMEIG